MEYRTDNPTADAQRYIADEREPETFKCNCCDKVFESGDGVNVTDEFFCDPCVDEGNHYDFYRKAGLDDKRIYQITEDFLKRI